MQYCDDCEYCGEACQGFSLLTEERDENGRCFNFCRILTEPERDEEARERWGDEALHAARDAGEV